MWDGGGRVSSGLESIGPWKSLLCSQPVVRPRSIGKTKKAAGNPGGSKIESKKDHFFFVGLTWPPAVS